jgi:hypothetical protein
MLGEEDPYWSTQSKNSIENVSNVFFSIFA